MSAKELDAKRKAADDTSLNEVQVDGLVVLKIIKHCKENLPELVTGQLLGLDVGTTLEVTNCFPFPSSAVAEEEGEEGDAQSLGGAEYQIEMMRCLREVNVDSNTVGWYSSTYLGTFLNEGTIETQFNYQERIKKCVVLIYDPLKTSTGFLSLRAYRLTPSFMELYKSKTFTKENLIKSKVSLQDIFEEVPVKISNLHLVNAFLFDLEASQTEDIEFNRLDLSFNPFLEKNLEFLSECLDDLAVEQSKFQYYQRSLQRQQSQQAAWLQKRRAENAQRKQQGEALLPEEDPSNPIFKHIPEPSHLESLLITTQINNYCGQIDQFAGSSISKLYLLNGLQPGQH